MSFQHLKVGDKVTRMLAGTVPMELLVVEVLDDKVKCDTPEHFIKDGQYWEFDRDTGTEIDEDLGWGPAHGVTGSYLVDKTTVN